MKSACFSLNRSKSLLACRPTVNAFSFAWFASPNDFSMVITLAARSMLRWKKLSLVARQCRHRSRISSNGPRSFENSSDSETTMSRNFELGFNRLSRYNFLRLRSDLKVGCIDEADDEDDDDEPLPLPPPPLNNPLFPPIAAAPLPTASFSLPDAVL